MKEKKKMEYPTPIVQFYLTGQNDVIATSTTVNGSREGDYGGVINDAWS